MPVPNPILPLPSPWRGLLLAVPLCLAACGAATPPAAITDDVVTVRVATAEAAPDRLALQFPGVLRARERSRVAPQIGGQLLQRPVRIGDQVRAGDLLAVISAPELEPAQQAAAAEVSALASDLRQADIDLTRARRIRAQGLLADEAVDQAESRHASLSARLQQAQARQRGAAASVAEQTLRATHAGVVSAVFAEAGDFLGAGQVLLELSNDKVLEVELQVPASVARTLDDDTEVRVLRAGDGKVMSAHVTENARSGSGPAALVRVVLEVVGDGLIAGDPIAAELYTAGQGGSQIPLRALRAMGGVPPATVLSVQDGRAVPIAVTPVAVIGDFALLADVLPATLLLITEAPSTLLPGDSVQILQ